MLVSSNRRVEYCDCFVPITILQNHNPGTIPRATNFLESLCFNGLRFLCSLKHPSVPNVKLAFLANTASVPRHRLRSLLRNLTTSLIATYPTISVPIHHTMSVGVCPLISHTSQSSPELNCEPERDHCPAMDSNSRFRQSQN